MKKNYSHLSAEDRAVIMLERSKGSSMRAIGRLLGRSESAQVLTASELFLMFGAMEQEEQPNQNAGAMSGLAHAAG